MRVVVTGGAGFIGSHVCDGLLAGGHEVLALDDLSTGSLVNLDSAQASGPRFSFLRVDVLSREAHEAIVAFTPSVVLHLAAQASVAISVSDPGRDATTNVLGTVRVLDAARAAKADRVVYAASGGTLYGDVDVAELPIDEDHPFAPSSPYGISKRVGLDYCAVYERLYGLNYSALALANVYGPRQDPQGEAGVAAIFGALALAGRPCTIEGDGEQTRDFVFVGDVARAFVLAAEHDAVGLVNIGTGKGTSVNALHAAVVSAAKSEEKALAAAARVGDLRHSSLDPSRAKALLGWTATTPLDRGVAETLAALGERLNASKQAPRGNEASR